MQCQQCHNSTFHFDRRRHAIVCDVCGFPTNSHEQTSELFEYDKNRQKAIAYIKAKDYLSAKPYLERMKSIHPDDADIYYLHLMGLTDCCQNYFLTSPNASILSEIEANWDKLRSLGGDTRIFTEYRSKRSSLLKEAIKNELWKKGLLFAGVYFLLLIAIALLSSQSYIGILPLVAFAVLAFQKKPLISLLKTAIKYYKLNDISNKSNFLFPL